jgi:hypothetical protein
MFVNPVNTADLSSYIKSTGYYNNSRITDRYDTAYSNAYFEKITNQSNYTPSSPISSSQNTFKNQFEKARKSTDTEDSLKSKQDKNSQEKSSKQVDSKSSGFILTVPEEHLKKLQDYKDDLQHQIYELFNPNPRAYIGALVDVVA